MPFYKNNIVLGTKLTVDQYKELMKKRNDSKPKPVTFLKKYIVYILSAIILLIILLVGILTSRDIKPQLITFSNINFNIINYAFDWSINDDYDTYLKLLPQQGEVNLLLINAFTLSDTFKLMPTNKSVYDSLVNALPQLNINVLLSARTGITDSYYDYVQKKAIISNTKTGDELMVDFFKGTQNRFSSFYSSVNSLMGKFKRPLATNPLHLTFDLAASSLETISLATFNFIKLFKQANSKIIVSLRLDIQNTTLPPMIQSSNLTDYLYQIIFGVRVPPINNSNTCRSLYSWSKWTLPSTIPIELISLELAYWSCKYMGLNLKKAKSSIIGAAATSFTMLTYNQMMIDTKNLSTNQQQQQFIHYNSNGSWIQTKTTGINYIDNEDVLEFLQTISQLNLNNITLNSINYLDIERDYSNVLINVLNRQVYNKNKYY